MVSVLRVRRVSRGGILLFYTPTSEMLQQQSDESSDQLLHDGGGGKMEIASPSNASLNSSRRQSSINSNGNGSVTLK